MMTDKLKEAYDEFVLQIPDIDYQNDYKTTPEENYEDDCRLTDLVRRQYLQFIENLLNKNYEEWSKQGSDNMVRFTAKEIRTCAEKLELQAVKSSMLVRLYRANILKLISEIRQETKNTEIHTKLIQQKFSHSETKYRDIAIQTDPEKKVEMLKKRTHHREPSTDASVSTTSALDLKIRSFQENVLKKSSKKLKLHRPIEPKRSVKPRLSLPANPSDILEKYREPMFSPPSFTPTPKHHHQHHPAIISSSNIALTPSPVLITTPTTVYLEPVLAVIPPAPAKDHEEDDKIMQELKNLFGDDEDKDESLQAIFEDCTNNPQIDAIMQEIEQYDDSKLELGNRSSTDNDTVILISPEISPKVELNTKEEAGTSKTVVFSEAELDEKKRKAIEHKLKNSLWPCELHMQTMKLREILSAVAEDDLYKLEIIKVRFVQLFDDDDTDELLAPYSPTIELNDILISSCRIRISRWVVNGLMKPLNQGLIANRFLFKKLAKRVADNIIYANQYPNERFIRKYIEEYFCSHPAINDVEDIT